MEPYQIPLETPCIYYDDQFLSQDEANAAYQDLLQNTAWETTAKINRWVALHEDTGEDSTTTASSNYKYRDNPSSTEQAKLPFTPTIARLRDKAQKWYNEKNDHQNHQNVKFNVCLLNFYEDGNQRIGWHADREEIGRTTPIASITLGATRDFLVRAKEGLERTSVTLTNGSLIVMENICQMKYLHSLPKQTDVTEGRINLTFRCKGVNEANTAGEEAHERRDRWIERIAEIQNDNNTSGADPYVGEDGTGNTRYVFGDRKETEDEDAETLKRMIVKFTVKTNIGVENQLLAEMEEALRNFTAATAAADNQDNKSETVEKQSWILIPRPWGVAGYVACGIIDGDNSSSDNRDGEALSALLKLRSAHYVMEYHDHFDLTDVAAHANANAKKKESGNSEEHTATSVGGEELYQYFKRRLVAQQASISAIEKVTSKCTFRTTCERIGAHHSFKSGDVEYEIGGALSEYYEKKAKPKMEGYDFNIRVDVIGSQVILGTQRCVDDLSKRHFCRYRNGVTVKCNLAYIMLRCANIHPRSEQCLVADPFCGSGTILLEALEITNQRIRCIGMDVSRRSVQGAKENAEAENVSDLCQFFCTDARAFRKHCEENSVDAIVTNLPWGVMTGHKNVSDLQDLYEIFLRTAWYVLKDGGRIVMLVLRGLQLTRIVRKLSGRYRLLRAQVVRTTNNLPCLVVIEKLPNDPLNDAIKGQLAYMSQFVNVSKEMYHAIVNEETNDGNKNVKHDREAFDDM